MFIIYNAIYGVAKEKDAVRLSYCLAEREGFEPSRRLLLYTRSRRASSTTPAPLRTVLHSTRYLASVPARL